MNMKTNIYFKIKRWSIYLIGLLVWNACSTEEFIPTSPVEKPDGDPTVTLNIAFPEASPNTYALTDGEEHFINSLEILVFTSGGTADMSDDRYAYSIFVPGSQIVNNNIANKQVTVTIKSMAAKQRLILLANKPASAVIQPLDTVAGTTKLRDIVGKLKFGSNLWKTMDTSKPGIPMWGQMTDSVLFNSSTPAQTIKMIRSLAKVELSVASTLGNKFRIKNVHLFNAYDSALIAPERVYLVKDSVPATVIHKINPPSSPILRADNPYTYPPYIPGATSLKNTIYVPESDTLNGAHQPAYLVLEATYGDHSGTPPTTWYRIDFSKDGAYQQLLRNHTYTLNILNVITAGYGSLNDAKNAPASLTNNALIIDKSSEINDIVYNDTHMMGTYASSVLFDWNKPWIGEQGSTGEYSMGFKTTYNTWTATSSESWVQIARPSGSFGATINNGVIADNAIRIKVTQDNRTGDDREATITFRSGMLTHSVKVIQSCGANSRMIRFGSGNTATTSIPLAFADKALGNNPFNSSSPFEAQIIWQEAGAGQATFSASISGTGLITEYQIDVTATAGTTQYGNAVVAIVRKGSGIPMVGGKDEDQIIWSWHIWSMPQSDDMDLDYHNPNKPLLMNDVLGKYTGNNGTFYQWGRKDPFLRSFAEASPVNVMKNEAAPGTNTLLEVVKNPATYYYHVTNAWTSELSTGLWGATKTYYDPCPVGWRMPNATEFSTNWPLADSSKPNSHFQNGKYDEVTGTWTISSGDHYIWVYNKTNVNINPAFSIGSSITPVTTPPSTGASVRCIKDIQLVKTSL